MVPRLVITLRYTESLASQSLRPSSKFTNFLRFRERGLLVKQDFENIFVKVYQS